MHEGLSTRRAGNDGVNRVMNQKETTSHAKFEEALGNLYNLEEEIEEDPTPFMTGLRLEEALSHLSQLEQTLEEEAYEKNEEKPLVGVFEELELIGRDTKGEVHKIGAMTKGVLQAHKLQKMKRNPDLIHLCNINNSKVYYNIPKDQCWIEVYQPTWINRKRIMKKVGSIKLEKHDIENMWAFADIVLHDCHNPIPKQRWITKKLRKKEQKILEKLSRKNHCFGKL